MKTVFKLIEDHGLTLHGDIEHFAEIIRADAIANEHKKLRSVLRQMHDAYSLASAKDFWEGYVPEPVQQEKNS